MFAGVHLPFVCNMICHARPLFGGIRGALLAAGMLLWWPLLSPFPNWPCLVPYRCFTFFSADPDDRGGCADHAF